MRRGKRLFLAVLSAALLTTASAAPVTVFALGDVQVTLSCSDGTDVTVDVDAATLLGFKDAVESMTLYPAGLSCSLTETPLLGAFGAGVAVAGNPQHDYAIGGGRFLSCLNFGLSAHSSPVGADPKGSVAETVPEPGPPCASESGHYEAEVKCLSVTGDAARMVAEYRNPGKGFFEPFGHVEVAVKDNGNPVNGIPVDLISFSSMAGAAPTTFPPGCTTAVTAASNLLSNGNIVVHDAP